MGRSKQNKTQKKDGQHRAETREERKERLRLQAESREKCLRLLPYAGGMIVLFLVMFSVYVYRTPPRPRKPPAARVLNAEQQGFDKEFLQQMMQEKVEAGATPEEAAAEVVKGLKMEGVNEAGEKVELGVGEKVDADETVDLDDAADVKVEEAAPEPPQEENPPEPSKDGATEL